MRVRYSFSSRKRTRVMDRHNQHRKTFPDLVRDLINTSDIILEVLDARFLQDTRNPELEALIAEKEKKLIYVINKTDLVDIKTLKKEIEELQLSPYSLVSCLDRRVADLRLRIKIESNNLKKETVNIGIVGYPNTGKSSVINSLVGRASARTSPESGFTKGIQKIKISDNLFIFDTPGVIPDKDIEMNKTSKLVKIGVKGYDRIKDPEMHVAELIKLNPDLFDKFYSIDAKGDSEKLIEFVGRKKHWLKRGDEVDTDRTSRFILRDWQENKLSLKK